ncbi:MAG: 16S rRNA (adenine(1518)-N(6)/adenine(1519)-N(6))-dimethyltransferase RsmA [Desulfobulbales bacterium]|nr:16S rRNA (adenine(1518)-N(6)/adenine(1519)-N(6))-dimethyltransferase RsmA [Desulfobulbales bacterium]
MSEQNNIKQILRSARLAPSKERGQNFLVNPATSEAIIAAAGVTGEDTIVELGVGLGAMTIPLAEKAEKVIGIELDKGIVKWHEEQKILPANVTLIHQDLLKADFRELSARIGSRLKIIANLPYSISNPLVFKLIENRECMEYAVLMLQKEVGQRLQAGPGTRTYGVLSVLLAACASTKIVMKLGPEQFHPRPKIDSVVTRIVFDPMPAQVRELPEHDPALLRKVVNAAFQQRRKTLFNSLSSSGIAGTDKKRLKLVLEKTGIDPRVRPEMLSVEDFVRLLNAIQRPDIQ